MTSLALRLAGPLQSWGTSSRFAFRGTDAQPSKSAVLGLLAAAQGRRRTDPIEDLLDLRFGVRCDQPGTHVRDFQTAHPMDGGKPLPLTYRHYLGDAAFVAVVDGDAGVIDGLAQALRNPAFPLYLGRRSCPPARPVPVGVREGSYVDVLRSTDPTTGVPWLASKWFRGRQGPTVELDIVRDVLDGERAHDRMPDAPISFDPHHRRYATRGVIREHVTVDNPDSRRAAREPVGALTTHVPLGMGDG